MSTGRLRSDKVLHFNSFFQDCFIPFLESLLSQLLDIIRDEASPPEVIHLAFKLMYMMTKVYDCFELRSLSKSGTSTSF